MNIYIFIIHTIYIMVNVKKFIQLLNELKYSLYINTNSISLFYNKYQIN